MVKNEKIMAKNLAVSEKSINLGPNLKNDLLSLTVMVRRRPGCRRIILSAIKNGAFFDTFFIWNAGNGFRHYK